MKTKSKQVDVLEEEEKLEVTFNFVKSTII
mgnify:CR=1 FL=1